MKKANAAHFYCKLIVVQLFFFTFSGTAQTKNDTIVITTKNVNTEVLKPSSNRYLVYFKMGKDSARSRAQFWTRNIEFTALYLYVK